VLIEKLVVWVGIFIDIVDSEWYDIVGTKAMGFKDKIPVFKKSSINK